MRSPIAIALFLIVIISTLLITRWAARRTHSRSEFYAAGAPSPAPRTVWPSRAISCRRRRSLGVAGLAFTGNSDAVLYIVAPLLGFTVMLLFIAEPLRNLGRYTVPEVVALRFPGRAVRAFTAAAALVVTIFYLIAQMVGAGALIEILLGVPYSLAVVVVATLMMLYVAFGGMLATTWVQITKAVVLIVGVLLMTVLTLSRVDYDIGLCIRRRARRWSRVHQQSNRSAELAVLDALARPGAVARRVRPAARLMRFFTVPDARQARRSIVVAMVLSRSCS
jgi:cation/acetate symporter